MEYSNEDLESEYDTSSEDEVVFWNAGAVYFDDEIVEYQGRRYMALRKTSAEVPGRCKAGIWKELHEAENFEYDEDLNLYEEAQPAFVSEKKAVSNTKQTLSPQKQVIKEERTKSVQPQNSTKPSVKKTLKEQQEERKQSMPQPQSAKAGSEVHNIEKKMTLPPTDQQIVNDILKDIGFEKIKGENLNEQSIISDLKLDEYAAFVKSKVSDIKLIWGSSHTNVISNKGKVFRPNDSQDAAVNLSITVQKGPASATRFFTVWVKAEEEVYSDTECVEMVCKALSFDHIRGNNSDQNRITADLGLLTHGLHDTEIFWASSDRSLMDETGHLYKERIKSKTEIRLFAIVVKEKAKCLKSFKLIVEL